MSLDTGKARRPCMVSAILAIATRRRESAIEKSVLRLETQAQRRDVQQQDKSVRGDID